MNCSIDSAVSFLLLGKWIYHRAKRCISEQNALAIWTAIDLPTPNVLATVRKELPERSLHSTIVTCYSTEIPRRNWVSLFYNVGWTTLAVSRKVSWFIPKSLLQWCSTFWLFDMLSNQSSSLWWAQTERLLQMFISKTVEVKICFLCRYALMLLILRINAHFFLFLYLTIIIHLMTYIISNFHFKSIIVMPSIVAEKIIFFNFP